MAWWVLCPGAGCGQARIDPDSKRSQFSLAKLTTSYYYIFIFIYIYIYTPMIQKNRHLITDEPVKFANNQLKSRNNQLRLQVTADHFRGIYRIYPQFNEEQPKDVNK